MTEMCKNCGKELKDETSLLRGYGPECWNSVNKHGVLEIPLLIRTQNESRDSINTNFDYKLFLTIDSTCLFDNYNTGWRYGIAPKGTEGNLMNDLIHQALCNMNAGDVELCLWAKSDIVPSRYMPEKPPNPENLPFENDNTVPLVSWHIRRGELVHLKPKKWELTKDKTKWKMKYDIIFGTGTLFVDTHGRTHDFWESESGGFVSEKLSEWLWEADDWLPTQELESWVDGEHKFWSDKNKANKKLNWLRDYISDRRILITSKIEMEDLLGRAYEDTQGYSKYTKALQDENDFYNILWDVSESLNNLNTPDVIEGIERARILTGWAGIVGIGHEAEPNRLDLLKCYGFFDGFEKAYMDMCADLYEADRKWMCEEVEEVSMTNKHYNKNPQWVRKLKHNLWVKFQELIEEYRKNSEDHTNTWGAEIEWDFDLEGEWEHIWNHHEDAIGNTALWHLLESEAKYSWNILSKWVLRTNSEAYAFLEIGDADLVLNNGHSRVRNKVREILDMN